MPTLVGRISPFFFGMIWISVRRLVALGGLTLNDRFEEDPEAYFREKVTESETNKQTKRHHG